MTTRRLPLALLAALSLVLWAGHARADWDWLNPWPQGDGLRSIDLLNADYGFAVGQNGVVVLTTDGGQSWDVRNLVGGELQGVCVTSESVAYAVGTGGTIMRTGDGGRTWTALPSGVMQGIAGVDFPSESLGYVCGENGMILKTRNYGDTWEVQNSHVAERLQAIQFKSPNAGYAVGANAKVVKTTNGGNNWMPVMLPGDPFNVNDLSFPVNEQTGYICGDGGRILRTTNGGAAWTAESLLSPMRVVLRSICFPVDNNTGYVCGDNGTIAKTTNGGATWIVQRQDPGFRALHSIRFTDNQTGYAAGDVGLILKTTDGGANWNPVTRGFTAVSHDMAFADTLTGYVASDGALMVTRDGGLTWSAESTALPFPIFAIANPEPSVVFGASMMGYIQRTTDYGTTWQVESCPGLMEDLVAISFPEDRNTGYALTMMGNLIKTVDGGAHWNQITPPDSQMPQSTIYFRTNNFGLAGGPAPYICRTTNG
ncbi:MAG: YCF48-related protein, partial [candidate division WOR-3 bacterium]